MSTQTWKIEVSINQGSDYQIVDAYKHGKFMVHLPVGQKISDNPDYAPDALWVISHRVTGLTVMAVWGRANARRIARRLDREITHDITKEDYERRTDDWGRFSKALKPLVGREKEAADEVVTQG